MIRSVRLLKSQAPGRAAARKLLLLSAARSPNSAIRSLAKRDNKSSFVFLRFWLPKTKSRCGATASKRAASATLRIAWRAFCD